MPVQVLQRKQLVKPFKHNVEKWSNILLKSCGVNTARFLKYIWQFFDVMHESVNLLYVVLNMFRVNNKGS